MVAIHADVTADRESLILLAGGLADPEDVALQAKRLKALTPLFSKSDPPGALVCPLTWPAVVQLSATFGDDFVPGPDLGAWIAGEIEKREHAGSGQRLGLILPNGLKPYPWQVEGADMIASLGSALITDEPGTGKTITTILGLCKRLEWEVPWPVLVVAPASVVDPWVEAWQRWAPHLRTVAWRGPVKKRTTLLGPDGRGTADVYVTSYDLARMDAPPQSSGRKLSPLMDLGAQSLVVDECHFIKNPTTARSAAVRRLARKARHVVGLSGTPITHNPGDLWPILDAIAHDAWPAKGRWVDRYCEQVRVDYDEPQILGLHPYTEPEFRLTLMGQHRRVAKADVLKDLPPKVYSTRTVDLPTGKDNNWRKVYDDFEQMMLAELPDGDELSVMDVMSKYGFLTRLASAAADVEVTFGPDLDERTGEPKRHVHLDLKMPSWKVDALLEILDERHQLKGEAPKPIVAFAPSRQLMVMAGEAAQALGYRVGYVIGDQSPRHRTETVAAFQAGALDLLCVTTQAGGVGLTLTAADTCVFLQRPWSIVESIQAEDRCHRIGSEIHDSVEVIDIVARNTIDSRVRAVLRERAGQLSDLVQDKRIVAELFGGSRSTERKSA